MFDYGKYIIIGGKFGNFYYSGGKLVTAIVISVSGGYNL